MSQEPAAHINLLTLGHGYVSSALARGIAGDGVTVTGATRNPAKHAQIAAEGVRPLDLAAAGPAIARATHILISAAPDAGGDPILADFAPELAAARDLRWIGYLSATSVYGDHQGGPVSEETPPAPATARGRDRLRAEQQWLALAEKHGLPLHIFRIAAIYGPGRGPVAALRNGTARRIVRPGLIFSRIHVDDIAGVLAVSMAAPAPGLLVNLSDDAPAAPEDVIEYAARCLGLPVPPAIPFDQAGLTPAARSFYTESKRVLNDRMKAIPGVSLRYPTYREGIRALITSADDGARPTQSA